MVNLSLAFLASTFGGGGGRYDLSK